MQPLSALLVAGICGCSGGPELEAIGLSQEADICGATFDWQDVEFYDGSNATFDNAFVGKYEGASGQHCSGTLIARDLFITVQHSGCDVAVGEKVKFNRQVDGTQPFPATQAAANTAADARSQEYTATEVLYDGGSGDPDISVTRLAGNPGDTYGWILPSVRVPPTNEHVAIFQHPQKPSIGPDRRKLVAFGPVMGATSVDLRYAVDTEGGSSGSGVLDRFGRLVAVHRASGCPSTGYNKGTVMSWVAREVPAVRSILASIAIRSLF